MDKTKSDNWMQWNRSRFNQRKAAVPALTAKQPQVEARVGRWAHLAKPNFQLLVWQHSEQYLVSVADHLDKGAGGMRRGQHFGPAHGEVHRSRGRAKSCAYDVPSGSAAVSVRRNRHREHWRGRVRDTAANDRANVDGNRQKLAYIAAYIYTAPSQNVNTILLTIRGEVKPNENIDNDLGESGCDNAYHDHVECQQCE